MKNPKVAFALAGLMLMPGAIYALDVKSPNGNVVLHADVVDGKPTYSVDYKNKKVIIPSTLGLELKDAENLTDGFKAAFDGAGIEMTYPHVNVHMI